MKHCSYSMGIVLDISICSDNQYRYITIGKTPYDISSRIILVYSDKTLVLDNNYNNIRLEDIEIGDEIVAYHSNAMTKSIPPQTVAYVIKLLKVRNNK